MVLTSLKTQSNGRLKGYNCILPAWDPYNGCVLIPLGSPTWGPEVRVRAVSGGVLVRVRVRGMVQDGYTGWVYWVGNTGEYYPATQPAAARSPTSGAGPGSPAGAGVGGLGGDYSVRRRARSLYHPAGPVGPAALPVQGPVGMPPLGQ